MDLTLTNQGVNGNIQVAGNSTVDSPEQPDTYTATVTGTLVNSQNV